MENLTNGPWTRIGTVTVDTGHVIISDAHENACAAIIKVWDDNMCETNDGVFTVTIPKKQGALEGVICESGGADGSYDVYIRRQDFGDGYAVTGLFVDFSLK